MVGTTTRARKKTKEPEVVEERVEEKADDERDTQIKLLSMTVQQHSVNMAVEVIVKVTLKGAVTTTHIACHTSVSFISFPSRSKKP